MKRLVLSGFGAGYFPLAPGTFASAVTAGFYLAAVFAWGEEWAAVAAGAGAAAFALATVVWARGLDGKDPSWVVSDEIAGMFLALAPPLGYTIVLKVSLAFIGFRAFDVAKPVGIRKLEKLSGGWGVVADDLASGALTGLILAAASAFVRLWR